MSTSPSSVAGVVAGALCVAALVALAGSEGGVRLATVPVIAIAAVAAFGINWIAFVPSYRARTERFYDLVGALTYLSLLGIALASSPRDPRTLLLSALIAIWAVRLGSFLFARVLREGRDRRFDSLKSSGPGFLMAWTLQGLWVFLTLSCALAAMTNQRSAPLGVAALLGSLVWAAGFAIEVVADRQKRVFRGDPDNRERFITTGLWAWSRHPNYFGEIVLWTGVAIVALPDLTGWQHVTLVSPLFVLLLLTRGSGIPLLEARADAKWGDRADYRAYRERTPVLWPRPPARSPRGS